MNCKKAILAVILAILLIFAAACQSDGGNGGTSGGVASSGSVMVEISNKEDMFTTRDETPDYDKEDAIYVNLSGNTASCEADGVTIAANVVTITKEGTYVLTGTLDGQIIINAEKTEKIQLVLDGATVTNTSSAAIYIKQADKVFLTLEDGTENSLSSYGEFVAIDENNIDGAIFSKEDLTINGSGKLYVYCESGHGIVSKDDLVITGGDISVEAKKHSLSGKDCVKIENAELSLTSGKDGIHSENEDDATLGYVYIASGKIVFNVESDGIDASNTLEIADGNFSGTCGGKGIKADGKVTVVGGTFDITSADDSFHSNASMVIAGGTITVASGDDGFHANETLCISGGDITVTKSYEGLEGAIVEITGGNISVTASDDGINAAGGKDESGFGGAFGDRFGGSSDSAIKISGGTIYVDAGGDGVDSNGDIYISGGEIYVSGATNGGDSALDYDGIATITGGTFVATGYSGMAQNFGSNSTQGSILVNLSSTTTKEVKITDENGNVLASYTPAKNYNSVVISAAGLKKGGTYTLTAGGTTTSITLTSLIYGEGMGGGQGGNPGGPGGNPGGFGGGPGGRR